MQNVKSICKAKGISPSFACQESGAGQLMDNLKRGSIPSVEKVQLLAAYLGVTTSELLGESGQTDVGDKKKPATESGELVDDLLLRQLQRNYADMNREGREKLVEYADDLVASGKYIKSRPAPMVDEA